MVGMLKVSDCCGKWFNIFLLIVVLKCSVSWLLNFGLILVILRLSCRFVGEILVVVVLVCGLF